MIFEYRVNGRSVRLETATDLLAVQFHEPAPYSARNAAMARPEISSFDDRIEVPKQKLTLFRVASRSAPLRERIDSAIAAVSGDDAVASCNPVFRLNGILGAATNTLLFAFSEPTAAEARSQLLARHGLKLVEKFDGMCLAEIPTHADAFEVARALDDEQDIVFAEPNFTVFGERLDRRNHDSRSLHQETDSRESSQPVRMDPSAQHQYAHELTETIMAWQIQEPDSTIRIAILDEGVDSRHPDLTDVLVGAYDGIDGDLYQDPNSWDSHGTACAGIAAARPVRGGVQGVAHGCCLLAVRIARSVYDERNRQYFWSTTNATIARSIEWAWQNGADILSNSWGGGMPSGAIERAIFNARTHGRNGRGSIVICAAGNDGGPPAFPSDLPEVLTVAASNKADEPKTYYSSDGEEWASNQGDAVDIAAPGVGVLTTDNIDRDGRNRSPGIQGNYVTDFNGTSAATPLVAGAAALVLSANPDLKEVEVRNILKRSADKVGAVAYRAGHNPQMGFGRLNVYGAVRLAQGLPARANTRGSDISERNSDSHPADPIPIHERLESTEGSAPGTDLDWFANPLVQGTGQDSEFGAARTMRSIAEASYGVPEDEPASEPSPLTVIGRDDRVRQHQTDIYPWRTIASLLVTTADGSEWWGTGWFAGPRTIVTAGHVVFINNRQSPSANGWVQRIKIMPGRDADRHPFQTVTSTVFRSVSGWTRNRDPERDYGAILLSEDLGAETGMLGIGVLDAEQLYASGISVVGYPMDKKPEGSMWTHSERVKTVGERRMHYAADTHGGQSGGPVFATDRSGSHVVAGIHAYGVDRSGFNSAVRITEAVYENIRNWVDEVS